MEKIFIDIDVIVDYLRGHQERIKDFFLRIEAGEIKGYIGWINVVELYSGADSKEKEEALMNLLEMFDIREETLESSMLAGKIRREKELGIADSIIASLAITSGMKLLTFNLKDFKKVKEIKFYILK